MENKVNYLKQLTILKNKYNISFAIERAIKDAINSADDVQDTFFIQNAIDAKNTAIGIIVASSGVLLCGAYEAVKYGSTATASSALCTFFGTVGLYFSAKGVSVADENIQYMIDKWENQANYFYQQRLKSETGAPIRGYYNEKRTLDAKYDWSKVPLFGADLKFDPNSLFNGQSLPSQIWISQMDTLKNLKGQTIYFQFGQ